MNLNQCVNSPDTQSKHTFIKPLFITIKVYKTSVNIRVNLTDVGMRKILRNTLPLIVTN